MIGHRGTFVILVVALVVAVFPFTIAIFAAIISANPVGVAHYPADGNCIDTENGFDCVLFGDAGYGVGQNGQAFDFDGVNDYAQIATNPTVGLDNATHASWVWWMNPRSLGQNDQGRVIDKGGGSSLSPASGYAINVNGGNALALQLNRDSGNDPLPRADGIFTIGEWQHLAVVYDSTTGTTHFYRDGILHTTVIESKLIGDVIVGNTEPLRIGIRATDLDRDFDGLIDNLRIFNIALTEQDVLDIFNTENGAPPPTPTPTPTPTATPPPPTACIYQRTYQWTGVWPNVADACYDPVALDAALATLPVGYAYIVTEDGRELRSQDADSIRPAASVSKSLVALGVMFAIDDGLMDLDEFTDLRLNHRSGGDNSLVPPCGAVGPVGDWSYSTCGVHEVALAIETVTGQSFPDYLTGKLTPLAVSITWNGALGFGAGAEMSVRDASKIMLMLARGGGWDGVQVVNPFILRDFTSGPCNPLVVQGDPPTYEVAGNAAPTMHCRGFWTGDDAGTLIPPRSFGMQGGIGGDVFVAWIAGHEIVGQSRGDTTIITAGPDTLRANSDRSHLEGQPHQAITQARTGYGDY